MKTYEWLNPPPGEYRKSEYLNMYMWYFHSASLNANKLRVRLDPMKAKFLGNCRVTVGPFKVTLEAIN